LDEAAPLREAWYYAAPSRSVRRGRLHARVMLGEPVVLGRAADGTPFALRDICPHRGMPLSAGTFDGCEIECCYHGWRFATDGACTAIPSVPSEQNVDRRPLAVPRYQAREVQGNIWVYLGDAPETAPEIPVLEGFGPDAAPRIVEQVSFAASIDDAVVGLMDPAHGPFVHRAWWWRGRHSIHEKAKPFVPSPWGFTMARHAPSSNSRAYKILGGGTDTEIAFRLPSVRVEHIRAGRHAVANLTAITPIDDKTSEINHCIYWTAPWLSALKPLARPYVRAFLRQDRDIMEKQQQGLRFNPTLSLIDDADTQARWYYRLKREYRRSLAEGRGFENPVEAKTLRWRS
jgi:phenylpropionate dioxygenase-like ring-hydroxylating dioxygenase large terminal subunit